MDLSLLDPLVSFVNNLYATNKMSTELPEIPIELVEFQLKGEYARRFTVAGYEGWAYCNNVYDGDTCQLSFAPNGMEKAARWTCRLARIETAEIGRRAKSARERTEARISRNALRKFINDKLVWVNVTSMGKYKRPIVEIYDKNSQCINDLMLECGAAVKYGIRPLPWHK